MQFSDRSSPAAVSHAVMLWFMDVVMCNDGDDNDDDEARGGRDAISWRHEPKES